MICYENSNYMDHIWTLKYKSYLLTLLTYLLRSAVSRKENSFVGLKMKYCSNYKFDFSRKKHQMGIMLNFDRLYPGLYTR
jgi:hypothetical protein